MTGEIPSTSSEPAVQRLRRRRRSLLTTVAVAVAVAVAGLGASSFIKSPQQLAAEAGPPKPSVITAPVERLELMQRVVLRGDVRPSRSIDVVPVRSTGAGKLVVSSPPLKVGARVRPGMVVSVVSGRPIIALHGPVPAYRDLRDGMKGTDVVQLRKALAAIGYATYDKDGVYGPSTQAAVKRLFEAKGFDPVTEGAAGRAPAKRRSVVLRSGEVLFVPAFPARVTKVQASLGAEATKAIVTLAAGELRVTGLLPRSERPLVHKGDKVSILAEDTGEKYSGKVAAIGSFTTGEQEAGHPVRITTTTRLPNSLAGQEVRLTIESASTNGKVLAVPLSAIFAMADDSTRVVKVASNGRHERIKVTTGAKADGFVEISGKGIAEGDRVVISEEPDNTDTGPAN